jgi:hypothetical protein
MAVVLGNLALLLDLALPRIVTSDRKTRTVALDVVLNMTKRSDPHAHYNAAVAFKSFDSDGEARSQRGKANSKANGVDFNAGSSEEEGEQEEPFDWEKEMRRRVKEIEERRELEKKAEELQNRVEDGEGEGEEETEEEKRKRVRKELEKVSLLILIIFIALVICLAP